MLSVAIAVVLLLLALFLTVLGLPGNWLMVLGLSAFAVWGGPFNPEFSLWAYVGATCAVALLGELIELFAGAAGMAKGGSKRGALLAIVGAIVGSILGAGLGLPIPVVGSIVGIVLCSSLGAMAGAVIGELWHGKSFGDSLAIGRAAFWGRLAGSGAKLACGAVIVVLGIVLVAKS